MISVKLWKKLRKKQEEFDKFILQKSQLDLRWVSRFNAERLKLALLVEVGEFANEIKSFKIWRKKKEIDLIKAKEELIDCLGYFLGLCNLFQIEITNSPIYPCERQDLIEMRKSFELVQEKFKLDIEKDPKLKNSEVSKKFATNFGKGLEEEITHLEKLYQWIYDKEVSFNKLLLDLFYKTNDLFIIEAKLGSGGLYVPEEIERYRGANTSYYHWLSVFNKICEKLQISEKELLDIYEKKNDFNYNRI